MHTTKARRQEMEAHPPVYKRRLVRKQVSDFKMP